MGESIAEPITLRLCWVVEGGSLAHPWVPSTTVVDNSQFVTLSKRDKHVMALLGLRSGCKEPTILDYAIRLRNKLVDRKILQKSMEDADPLAECEGYASRKSRRIMVDDIDHVLELAIPQLGDTPAYSMKVLSSSRKQDNLSMELTTDNLNYLMTVNQSDIISEIAQPIQDKVEVEVPIEERNVKYNHGRRFAYVRYRTADGVWKQHSKVIARIDNEEIWLMFLKAACQELQQFYDAHHYDGDARGGEHGI